MPTSTLLKYPYFKGIAVHVKTRPVDFNSHVIADLDNDIVTTINCQGATNKFPISRVHGTSTLKMEFPFDSLEVNGDTYIDSLMDAKNAGFSLNQIWAVLETSESSVAGANPIAVFSYTHPFCIVNRIGYIVTAEPFSHLVTFEEELSRVDSM